MITYLYIDNDVSYGTELPTGRLHLYSLAQDDGVGYPRRIADRTLETRAVKGGTEIVNCRPRN
jgi:hypothetical protein